MADYQKIDDSMIIIISPWARWCSGRSASRLGGLHWAEADESASPTGRTGSSFWGAWWSESHTHSRITIISCPNASSFSQTSSHRQWWRLFTSLPRARLECSLRSRIEPSGRIRCSRWGQLSQTFSSWTLGGFIVLTGALAQAWLLEELMLYYQIEWCTRQQVYLHQ